MRADNAQKRNDIRYAYNCLCMYQAAVMEAVY